LLTNLIIISTNFFKTSFYYLFFLFVIESIKILNDIKHSLVNNVPKVILQRTLLNVHEKQHVQNRKRKMVYLYYYFHLYYYLFNLLFHIAVNYTTNNLI